VGAFYPPHLPAATGCFLDVIGRVPYLATSASPSLQLLPIQEFPGDFSLGYNGTDYYSPESAYAVSDERSTVT